MRKLRARIVSALTHRYLARLHAEGFNLSRVGLLPPAALLPLRRNGMDPVPELARLRRQEPVVKMALPFGLTVWLVTGYAQARAVLGDAVTFSTDFAHLAGSSEVATPGGLGFADPPVHTRLRRLLTPEFTTRRLARLTPRIGDIVNERLDAMAEMAAMGAPVDLVQNFAVPIPALVICELLGVPYDERPAFQQLAMSRFDLLAGADASLAAISDSLAYLGEVVRRERLSPGDGLLGMIIKEHGDNIDDRELAGLADGVLTGGFETTASMLALGTLVLLKDQHMFRLIHDDDAAAAPFVEELLRHLSVVQITFPGLPATTSASTGWTSRAVTWSSSPSARPTGMTNSAVTWTPSTRLDSPPRTWLSVMAYTAASVRNWPGWNYARPIPLWYDDFRTCD